MTVRLTITDDNAPGDEYIRSFVQGRIILGRTKTCDICLPDMSVSARHVEIKLSNNKYVAVDLGSLNGTWISQKKLVAHRPKALKNNDILNVANFSVRFQLGVTPGPIADRNETTTQARKMLASILSSSGTALSEPAIVILSGPDKAARFKLPQDGERARIGRARNVEIRLEDKEISREHAEIVRNGDTVIVRDLKSRNGIIFRGEPVEELVLQNGTSFVVGNTAMGLEHPIDIPLATIQDAPEEETSSFSPDLLKGKLYPQKNGSIQPPSKKEAPKKTSEPPLPIGPEDPLSYPNQPGYQKTTRELPRQINDKSDLGLIVVGAVIVVAAVAALAWIFT